MILLGVIESEVNQPGAMNQQKTIYASAMGTIARPWYESTRNDREETRAYAW